MLASRARGAPIWSAATKGSASNIEPASTAKKPTTNSPPSCGSKTRSIGPKPSPFIAPNPRQPPPVALPPRPRARTADPPQSLPPNPQARVSGRVPELKAQRAWQPLRRTVTDMPRRAEVSLAANKRYLDSLASTQVSTPLGERILSAQENFCNFPQSTPI